MVKVAFCIIGSKLNINHTILLQNINLENCSYHHLLLKYRYLHCKQNYPNRVQPNLTYLT